MQFRYLSEVHFTLSGEEGKIGLRADQKTWKRLTDQLKTAIIDLRSLMTAPRPAAPARAAVLAPGANKVRELVKFHQASQSATATDAAIVAATRKVNDYRRWLTQQGVKTDKDGNLTAVEYRVVVYDKTADVQAMTQIHFQSGRLFTDAACRRPLDTTEMLTHTSGPGKAIYIMSAAGNIHVSSHVVGNRHHSSLLKGAPVACGGELEVKSGQLVWLSNKSGHYAPQVPHLLQTIHQLDKKQVPMDFRLTVLPDNVQYPNVGAFLAKLKLNEEPDYELGKLMAYPQLMDSNVLASNGWRWRLQDCSEKPGVYVIATGAMVPHKTVRTWLKSQGHFANPIVQPAIRL
ncbi:MAG: hypothetical protein JWO52_6461 [Gammaproteobacteria bacterium]|jgi:hypothetical protein|nr:hypothetical protein [Gammaproteobacteria bacterium]